MTKYKFEQIEDLNKLPENGIVFTWANKEKFQWLNNNYYSELECKTDDREAFLINIDTKEFEIVHKHQII